MYATIMFTLLVFSSRQHSMYV